MSWLAEVWEKEKKNAEFNVTNGEWQVSWLAANARGFYSKPHG